MSFRLKILSCFLSLLGAVLWASLSIVNRRETKRAEETVRSGISTAHVVFQELLDRQESQLTTSLRLLSGDFAFKQAVATGDAPTVLSAALNHKARIGADVLIVTDGEGKLLADTRRKLRPGRSMKTVEVVRGALEEKAASRLQSLDGTPYQLAAVPLAAPDLIGTLTAGFQIDDRLAKSLKRLTDTEVCFASGGKIFASTLEGAAREDAAKDLANVGEGSSRLRTFGGERFLVLASKPGSEVTAVIMRSWDKAWEPIKEMQQLLLVVGLCGLAATGLLGLLIASSVTASLEQLAEATVKLAKGQYDIKIDIRSKDEVGQLGEAFTNMAKGMVEREKIRSVLRKAVSKEIAEALLAQGKIELGGEEKKVTVLFSDIRSFTTISESLEPKELVSQLNSYFIGMARAIELHHGVIDKYVGDAIMALFGAPLGSPGDAANGLKAALAMLSALDGINAARAQKGLAAWNNGIGLNTGNVVAGTLGSEDRWSYTVIGDSVNLASRLEGLTKHYGVKLIVSEMTREAAGPSFAYRTLDRVIVKGRHEPVTIFEVLGEGMAPSWIAGFEMGLAAFHGQRWDEAEAAFRGLPEDGPSLMYLARIASLRGKSLAEDWDAPTKMTEK